MTDTLLSLIEHQAGKTPTAPAVVEIDGRTMTYAELADLIRHTAIELRHMGVTRTDRVAIALSNGHDAALSFLGAATAATAAPLNPAYAQKEFEYYLEDLQAKLLLADESATPAAVAAATRLGIRVSSFPIPSFAGRNDGAIEPFAGSDDVALVLHTSGTTSRPKMVPLTHANLISSARSIARSLKLTQADRALNVMPLFHIHGLVAAVLSTLASGGRVACSPGFDAGEFFHWTRAFGATWYTAVPTMHQAILRQAANEPRSNGGSRLRFARSCSSALPPKLMAELEEALGVPVIEAYGMTEASHQMTSNPLPPRARKPGSVGVATGIEVGTMDEAGNLLPPHTTGEVVIRGQSVTQGYESPPEANSTAFANGWFRTGDQGHIDDDGYLYLSGRLKEIINRGGEKISPREIDEVLLDHPAVAQAVAFARPHPTLGEDIAAAIVLHTGASTTPELIRELCFAKLADFKVPGEVLIVDQIPKGPTGKLQRIGLFEKLRDHFAGGYVAPGNAVELLICDIWTEILGTDCIGVNDNFFSLGGDSLRGARVVSRVNDVFALNIGVTSIFHAPTISQFAPLVLGQADPDRIAEIADQLAEIETSADKEVEPAINSSEG